jgi:Leucine-rich repeat (LRR) protein
MAALYFLGMRRLDSESPQQKSLQLNGGIMHALKLSYDELPFYLQQCFMYCSIFPSDHQFLSSELVYIWIAQGFVKCSRSTERLEDVGQRYLTDLLNFGFFEQVGTKHPTLGDKISYVMPALIHDFARLVSGTECAAIDDLTCREILPTIRHLSILTYSAYQEDKYGNILRNEKFEGKLQRVVNSTRKLRTLVLIGKYDYYFLQSLQGIFQKAQNLRALKISEAYVDFGYSACNLVNSTHVRYLKLKTKEDNEALPEALSKFYHLQVLDIGLDRYSAVPNGMNNLISLRHLVASKAVHSSISSIGKMSSLQELHHFKVENGTSFEITQLQTMSELAQLDVSQLENVMTREEAHGAKLREKVHLEKLQLSWDYALSQHGYVNSMSSEPSFVVAEIGTSKEVLEGLEPHHNLKHLQISGYRSGTSPDWLVSTVSVTCLQTLHLEDCRELQVLPSLESLPLLTKLKLNNMWKVTQITVPSLEELVLIKMPQLERCSCNSVRDLNSSLKVLMVKECRVLKVFPLFESCAKLGIDQQSWLSRISELTIHDCPCLTVSNSLPPSSSVCRLSISGVLTLPMIEGSTNRELEIGSLFSKYPGNLDGKILAFHNLRALTSLILQQNGLGISPVSLECFRQLISLKSLEINGCGDIIFSSDVLLEHAHEDMGDINFNALPSLKHLSISECGITGKWLSVMLRHAPALEELSLCRCDQISGLLIEGGECSSSNHTSTPRTSSAGNPDGTVTGSTPEGLLRIPSDSVSSLKRMSILWCEELAFQGNKEGFSVFTSLGMPQADHVFGADIRKQRAAKRKMASPVFTWQT